MISGSTSRPVQTNSLSRSTGSAFCISARRRPQTTFVIFASRSAASSVRPSSPRIVYRSLLTSCACTRAWTTSSSVTPSARAVVGAPMARSASRTSCQFPAWRYIIMIVPTPHCSPCKPGFFAIRSRACENLCSLPEAGREEPAIDIATPLETSALHTNHALSSRRGLIVGAFSITRCAASSLRPAADAERESDITLADFLFSFANLFHRGVRDQEFRRPDLTRREFHLDRRARNLHRRFVRDDQGALPQLQRLTDLADRVERVVADDDVSRELHRLRLREGLRVHRRHCGSPKPGPRDYLYLNPTTPFSASRSAAMTGCPKGPRSAALWGPTSQRWYPSPMLRIVNQLREAFEFRLLRFRGDDPPDRRLLVGWGLRLKELPRRPVRAA